MNPQTSTKNPEEVKKQIQAQTEQIQKIFDESVARNHEQLKNTHFKKEFTFTIVEKRRLVQQQTVVYLAEQAIDDIINLTVLPRLDITPNPNVKIQYDVALGRFVCWIPKEEKSQNEQSSSANNQPT